LGIFILSFCMMCWISSWCIPQCTTASLGVGSRF
jgi:hypothetical protein